MPLRAKRSNLIPDKIKDYGIAASLTLLAMTARIEVFRALLDIINIRFAKMLLIFQPINRPL